MDVQKRDDTLRLFQVNRSDFLIRFQLRIPLFNEGLKLVDLEDLLSWILLTIEIRQQGKDAIGLLVSADSVLINAEGDGINLLPGDVVRTVLGRSSSALVIPLVLSCGVNLIRDQ